MITIDFVVGDSIAAGVAISGFGLPRSGDSGKPPSKDDKGISQVGANPTTVLGFLNEIGADKLKSKNIVLSSGISNGLDDIEVVKKQLEFLQSLSAKVYLIGVTNNPSDTKPKFIGMNKKLEDLCTQFSYKFLGGFEPGDTQKVHPNYREYYKTNIKPVLEAGEGQDVSTKLENEKNKDKSPEAEKLPQEAVIPEIDPEKVFIFNVEKENLFRNADIGSFSIVPIEVEFEFSGGQDEFLLDEEYIEAEFVGEEEKLGRIRGEYPDEDKNNSKTENDLVDDSPNQDSGDGSGGSDDIIGSAIADITVKDAIIKVMKILIKNGFSEEQAAAICGNIKAESGFKHWNIEDGCVNIQPRGDKDDRWDELKAKNKNRINLTFSGWGLAQWSYGRRTRCEKFVGKYLKDKGVSVKTLRQANGNWILDTDPGLHAGFDSKKPYLGGTDNSPLEKYLKTVPHLFDAQVEYLSYELKNNYARIGNKLFNGISAGNTERIISAGAFINQSGGKPQKNIGAYTEAVLCDFEVPGSVSVVWNEPGQSSNKIYRKTAEERIKNAKDCLATWKSK